MFAVLAIGVFTIFASPLLNQWLSAAPLTPSAVSGQDSSPTLTPISIDYPDDGSIFPPGITPPTFLWRDAAGTSWRIDISFADQAPTLHMFPRGDHLRVGAIDPDCVANPQDVPKLTPQQAASLTWTPDSSTWSDIQLHSTGKPATITITGYRNGETAFSQSHFTMTTSEDPVGAPIFYRDVP